MLVSKFKKREKPDRNINVSNARTTKRGYSFDYNSDEWRLDGTNVIRFKNLTELDFATADGFRRSLCRYAEELSADHTLNMFHRFNDCIKFIGTGNITVEGIANYRASFDSENEYKLGALKGFLLAWYEWNFEGIDSKVAHFLQELTLKGNVKGKAVKRFCPYSGPLSHNELGALIEWASNAFSNGKLGLDEYSFFMAIALTGRRAVQIRYLRSDDLIVRETSTGSDYVIRCPRAKQRGSKFREQFSSLPINEDLYLILSSQRNSSITIIEEQVGEQLSAEDKKTVPIFLEKPRLDELTTVSTFKKYSTEIPDYLYLSRDTASELLTRVSIKNTARSERTGEYINFTASRFRYTKGTNLARRGISGTALAVALDHSDTQNINVYVENTEETAIQIDEIMAPVMAPLAQAFAGNLILSERDALRRNDPNSRVKSNRSIDLGNCGTHAFCASGYRACYTCSNFQPWIEAPHHEVLEDVLSERARQSELDISSHVIQATDRLLLAVQQVILMCKSEKEKRGLLDV